MFMAIARFFVIYTLRIMSMCINCQLVIIYCKQTTGDVTTHSKLDLSSFWAGVFHNYKRLIYHNTVQYIALLSFFIKKIGQNVYLNYMVIRINLIFFVYT